MSHNDWLTTTPEPPYTAVIFTSRRTTTDDKGYSEMAQLMGTLSAQQPGFLGVESARGNDRVGITVSYWATPAHAQAWKQVAEHIGAQRTGRERWYEDYATRIATVERDYTMDTSTFE